MIHPIEDAAMPRGSRIVAVMTGDIIASKRYPPRERQRLDRMLHAAFGDMEKRFPGAIHTRLAFRITAGDEFQCVIRDVPRALEIMTYVRAVVATGGLRPPVRFRASLGVGEISVGKRANPYEEDGPAFVRSRQGLDELDRMRSPKRWTKLLTGKKERDSAADAVLCLADYLFEQWTVPQWEAVRWTLLGHTRQEISKKLGIAHQNVTKRLLAAGWPFLESPFRFVGGLLQDASGTLKRV
jgi:SatD family (SatD)